MVPHTSTCTTWTFMSPRSSTTWRRSSPPGCEALRLSAHAATPIVRTWSETHKQRVVCFSTQPTMRSLAPASLAPVSLGSRTPPPPPPRSSTLTSFSRSCSSTPSLLFLCHPFFLPSLFSLPPFSCSSFLFFLLL